MVLHLLCPVTCCRYLKGGMHFPGKLLVILVAGDLHELFLPGESGCATLSIWMHSVGRNLDSQEVRVVTMVASTVVSSSSSKSCWRWGSSCGEDSRSTSSSSAGVVWTSFHHCAWHTLSCGVTLAWCQLSCHDGGINWWPTSTLMSCQCSSTSCCSMLKHLQEQVLAEETAMGPYWLLLKVGISIQPWLCLDTSFFYIQCLYYCSI